MGGLQETKQEKQKIGNADHKLTVWCPQELLLHL